MSHPAWKRDLVLIQVLTTCRSATTMLMKMRRPCRAAISSIASGMIWPEEISTTPRPGPPIAPTRASNSETSLIVEGIGTPPQPECRSDRALVHRLGDEPAHFSEFGGGRLFAHRGVLAHYGGAYRRMPDQNADVHIRAAPAQHRHVFGERLKLPVYTRAQRVEVHTLDDCQVPHDHVAQRRRRGYDAEAAIAHDRGCDPERGVFWRSRSAG
jgi:hypothetical protein